MAERHKILNEMWDALCTYSTIESVPLDPDKDVRVVMGDRTGDLAYISNSLDPDEARAVARAIVMAPRMLNLLEFAQRADLDDPHVRDRWLAAVERTLDVAKNTTPFVNE